ncbi:MAG: hypothetical protein UY63_C0017G0052 [Parcubacteria group bacterium GW2011_GWA2_51_10]|nr:MAG: hypothetical protein UY63_C0017G0052 [Parcubacteria group bacterium GW2011_GWA2_51_10]
MDEIRAVEAPITRPRPHIEFFRRHRDHWMHSESRSATIFSLILFAASMAIAYFAEIYATEKATNAVGDIVLDKIAIFDVDWFYIWGALALLIFAASLLITNPKRIPFTLHSFTLYFLIRAFFISLTHLGLPVPPPVEVWTVTSRMVFGGGLFFSGHVGAPYLLALLFWRKKRLRYIFIGSSIVFATTALLGHYHYTIDVVAAYFITYSIFHIAKTLFKKDRALFESETAKETT